MRPRDEWLNQQIEGARLSANTTGQPDEPVTDDPEVMELASLARSLQKARPLQVDPGFAQQLEQRMLAYSAARQRARHSWFAKGRVTFIPDGLSRWFWFETALATVTGILFIITLVWRDWIEIVFHVDPDKESGLLEWSIVGALLITTITLIILARYEWRKTQVAPS